MSASSVVFLPSPCSEKQSDLERQIVCLIGRRARGCRSCCRSGVDRSCGSSRFNVAARHAPCRDVIIPTAIVFTCVNVKRNGQLFAHLNLHLVETVFAENSEHALLGILVMSLDDKFLRLPAVARSCRNAAARLKGCNNLSCDFHIVLLLLFKKLRQKYIFLCKK